MPPTQCARRLLLLLLLLPLLLPLLLAAPPCFRLLLILLGRLLSRALPLTLLLSSLLSSFALQSPAQGGLAVAKHPAHQLLTGQLEQPNGQQDKSTKGGAHS